MEREFRVVLKLTTQVPNCFNKPFNPDDVRRELDNLIAEWGGIGTYSIESCEEIKSTASSPAIDPKTHKVFVFEDTKPYSNSHAAVIASSEQQARELLMLREDRYFPYRYAHDAKRIKLHSIQEIAMGVVHIAAFPE